jgi:hypothetical protein
MFMHRWGSRQDELTVFYRTGPSDPWISLQSYTQSITVWTEQVLPLPVVSSQFQLAFEGNAKFGFGVCIDDIMIDGTIVGIGELAPDEIRVFPNPSDGIFRVSNGNKMNPVSEITVFDCTGKRLTSLNGNGSEETTLDLSFADPGMYFLKIKTKKEVLFRKVTLIK